MEALVISSGGGAGDCGGELEGQEEPAPPDTRTESISFTIPGSLQGLTPIHSTPPGSPQGLIPAHSTPSGHSPEHDPCTPVDSPQRLSPCTPVGSPQRLAPCTPVDSPQRLAPCTPVDSPQRLAPCTPVRSPQRYNALVHSPAGNKTMNKRRKVGVLERAIQIWMNHHFKAETKKVVDLRTDLQDGLFLASLLSKLSQRPVNCPHTTLPLSSTEKIKNMDEVIAFLENEGITSINDDKASRKLVEGNFKFTIEVCKSIITHYHFTFGRSQTTPPPSQTPPPSASQPLPPLVHKDRLLLWLKAVLPHYNASDITTQDWEDGKLLKYLLAGMSDSPLQTATEADLSDIITEAEANLGIPPVLSIEGLQDEGEFILTMYLYFFANVGSCGQSKLLQWVNSLTPFLDNHVADFQEDWANGKQVYQVVQSLLPRHLSFLPTATQDPPLQLIQRAITAAEEGLNITPAFTALDLSFPSKDSFPLILFLSQLQFASQPSSAVFVHKDIRQLYCVGSNVSIELDSADSPGSDLIAVVQGKGRGPEERILLENVNNSFSFVPQHVGQFSIAVMCNNREIPDSPMEFQVYDPTKCRIVSSLESTYLVDQLVSLDVSTSAAGMGQLSATCILQETHPPSNPSLEPHPSEPHPPLNPSSETNPPSDPSLEPHPPLNPSSETNPPSDPSLEPHPLPEARAMVRVEELQDSIHRVSFIPQVQGVYQVLLTFNKNKVPIPIKFDCREVIVDDLKATPISTPSTFSIRTSPPGRGVIISVTGPQGEEVQVDRASGSRYSYLPLQHGEYIVTASPSRNVTCPFHVFHDDPSLAKQCKIIIREFVVEESSTMKGIRLDVPLEILVDCSYGGEGTLKALLQSPDGKEIIVPSQCEDSHYTVSYTPHQVGEHQVSLLWNGTLIPPCPLVIPADDPSCCSVQGLSRAFEGPGLENDFDIVVMSGVGPFNSDSNSVSVVIKDTRLEDYAEIENSISMLQKDGASARYRCRCRYLVPPVQHEHSKTDLLVEVRWKGLSIDNSPFKVPVSHKTLCWSVRDYPESHCIVNHPITAIVSAADGTNGPVNEGGFRISVSHDGQQDALEAKVKAIIGEENEFSVSFTPPDEGLYHLSICYNEELVPDGDIDFEVKEVFVRDFPKNPCQVNETVTMTLDASNASSTSISKESIKASICRFAQNGDAVDAEVAVFVDPAGLPGQENVFAITFTPLSTGSHKMKVFFDDVQLKRDMPFEVVAPRLANPRMTVQDFSHDDTHCVVKVHLLAPNSILKGFRAEHRMLEDGEYDVQAMGEDTGKSLHADFHQEGAGEYIVTLHTVTPDTYGLSIRYFGDLIKCCPFAVDVKPNVVSYDPVIPFDIDTIELVLDTSECPHKTTKDDFTVTVRSAYTQSVYEQVGMAEDPQDPDLFRVCFLPHQYDEFTVDVKWFCLHVDGSPFSIPFKQQTSRPQVSVNFQPSCGSRTSIAAKLNGEESDTVEHTDSRSLPAGTTFKVLFYKDEDSDFPNDETRLPGPVLEGRGHPAEGGGGSDAESCGSYSLEPAPLPQIAVQQYKRGHYQIWFVDYQSGHYSLHVYSLGKEIKGSPFPISTIPKRPDFEMMEDVQVSGRRGILSARVWVEEDDTTRPVPITLAMSLAREKAIVKFKDVRRDVYQLMLYWNYVPFRESPFVLTKHHDSAVYQETKRNRDK